MVRNHKYILLTKYIPEDENASQKAPKDIEDIFKKNFGKACRIYNTDIRILRNINSVLNYLKLFFKPNKADITLVVQYPLYCRKPFKDDFIFKLGLKKTVAIIHDIDSLRINPENDIKIKTEIHQLNQFNTVICHNPEMNKWLRDKGVVTELIDLNVFDYLGENLLSIKHQYPYRIVIAGNLNKSVFLKNIDQVLTYPLVAYGLLTKFKVPNNMLYQGSYSPDKLRAAIIGEFGLIWDGESCESCTGTNGNYMRYNNPHKLSLYLSCGLPIITWKNAAIATYVLKHKIGIVVDSLDQINEILNNLSDQTYKEYLTNVNKIKDKVLNGQNTIDAIEKALHNNAVEKYSGKTEIIKS